MKGIPTPCIKYYANNNNITVLDVYKNLYNNKEINFDLTNEGQKFVCRNNKNHTVRNICEGYPGSTRTVKFIRNNKVKIYIHYYILC